MPSADKRQRKKDNARMAREAREAEVKKRKRNRTIRNAAIAIGVFVIAIVVISLLSNKNGDNGSVAVSPTSTPPTTVAKDTHQKQPAVTIDPNKTYTADISTDYGDIKIALDAKNAPKGVNNFVHLARQGFYDGLTFHRLVKDFVIQGGDPQGNGEGGPGYTIVTELPKNGYPLGTIAWAKTGVAPAGSAGSQFFIVTADRPVSLETKQSGSYQYGAFGHVVSGMPVVKKIESFAPSGQGGAPAQPIYIKKVTITEK